MHATPILAEQGFWHKCSMKPHIISNGPGHVFECKHIISCGKGIPIFEIDLMLA